MKKRLKIKQLLLGIGLSILGLLTLSNSDVNAVNIVPGVTASEGQVFYANQGTSSQRMITFLAPDNYNPADSSSAMSVMYSLNTSTASYTFMWSGCKIYNYVPGQVSSNIQCNSSRYEFPNNSTSSNVQSISLYIQINIDVNNNLILSAKMSDESSFTEFLASNPYQEGYNEGYDTGYDEGYDTGYDEGYDTGISSTNGYQEGYEAGYNAGYVTNNTIPNIYIQSSNLIYNTGYFPLQISITDYINNLNGKLDFTALYNYDFAGAPNQNMIGELVLNTEIPVSDTLKFDLVNNDTLSNNLWVILGNTNNSCNNDDYGINCLYLTYSDLVNNNYMITASTLYPNLNITEFNYIQLSFEYRNNMMYGVKSITDITMTSTADSEYDIGYNVGYIVGKNEGMLLGRTEAYNLGYEAGLDYQFNNENTITGMMGTLFTMPINMFKTIFDFEFLGVNLAGFFLSLVTLLVVIWLIKKFI